MLLTVSEFTCDIQTCLANNGYKQEKCEHLVDRLYECCRSFYARHPEVTDVASCPQPEKLEEKMHARQEEKENRHSK
jgi:hypothetical protein